MKNLLVAALCFLVLSASSQDKAGIKELSVYGQDGKTAIAKVLVDASFKSNLFLIKSIQKKDSIGNYITTFYLGNKETTPVAGIKILMKFSKPVIDVTPDNFSSAFNTIKGMSDDRLQYIFKAAPLNRD